jgi:hypothetical protein
MSLLLESDSGFFPNPAPAANLPEVAALPNTSAGIPARELAAAPDFTTKVVCPHCHTEISLRAPQGQNALLMAMLAQASCRGTEIHCVTCGLDFVYFRPPTTELPQA